MSGYPYATGGASPLMHPQPYSPSSGGQIVPGNVTYTTSTGPDGRVIYHPFKAVPASYQTSTGVVSGIQWVPAEATQILPPGAQPATAEFAASWNRGYLSHQDQKALKEWQKEEERRRKKEAKEAKRLREKEADTRRVLERDYERGKSFSTGVPPGMDPGYPMSAYSPAATGHLGDLDRRIGEMGLDSRKDDDKHRVRSSTTSSIYGSSVYAPSGPGYPAVRGNTFPVAALPHRPPSRNASPNIRPGEITGSVYQAPLRNASPNIRPGEIMGSVYQAPLRNEPIARSSSPFGAPVPVPAANIYPRGHVMEGQPIMPRSRPTTPLPGMTAGSGVTGFPQPSVPIVAPSPRSMHSQFPADQALAAPEAFGRHINPAQSYTPFETMKVQDMDDFLDTLPRMPLVLQPHDVYHEDWIRFTQDLTRAWSGNLPVADKTGHQTKKSALSADLINVWNMSFFLARGVEVALYKGREKRTGPDAGSIDDRLPGFNRDDESSSSTSSSEESDSSDGGRGGYGRYDSHEARIRRQEKKAEKKRRAKEKKQRKKAKQREKKYALYLMCVPHAGAPVYGSLGGHSSPMPRPTSLIGAAGGRTSPMPGGGFNPITGRTSPIPGGFAGGRTSPMPGSYSAKGY